MSKGYQQVNVIINVRTLILTIIYFSFLYAFKIPGLNIGSALPILIFLSVYIGWYIMKGKVNLRLCKMTSKMVRAYWLWNIFLLIYVYGLIQLSGIIDGITPINDYLHMLLILPIFYISGNLIFRNLDELMTVLYLGVIIQSLIIIIALFSPVMTLALTLFFPEGAYNSDIMGGFEKTIADGYKIGLGVYSSAGSLKMAIGQIGAYYYLAKSNGFKLFCHLIIYLLITAATSMVARTGLMISLGGLLFIFILKWQQGGHRAFKYIIIILISLLFGYSIATTFLSSNFFEETFHRLIDTLDKGIHDTYFRGYTGEGGDNSIPSISIETIIGLGITFGISGSGIRTITDGGFLKNYSAMGLIIAIINYIIIARFIIKQYKSCKLLDYKSIIIFISFILIIGEFKEYYIYYISPICFIFLILGLIERGNVYQNLNSINRLK